MIWTNLDFEYELRHGRAWQPPRAVLEHMTRWRTLLRCMPGRARDACWEGGAAPGTMQCWGESRRALEAMGHEQIEARLEAVIGANDKRTTYAISRLPQLPDAGIIETLEAFHERLSRCPHDWIVKHPLGVSGRERVAGRAGLIEPRHEAWLRRQFDAGDALIFEPRVDIEEEFSCHFNILSSGEVEVMGHCTLLTDTQGTHRGHIVRARSLLEAPDERVCEEVRGLHAHTGYTGPVSSDGFVGRLGGERVRREVSEFNARITFGRVALELARELEPGWSMAWWHPRRGERGTRGVLDVFEPDRPETTGWFRLPEHVDEGGASATALYVARDEELTSLDEVERRWRALRVGD